MQFQTVELAYRDNVATITLNRPDKRNALSFQLLDELIVALDEIEKSTAQILILTGAGKAFCAGMLTSRALIFTSSMSCSSISSWSSGNSTQPRLLKL